MINLKVDRSSEMAGIYPASRISSSNSDFAFFPQQMTTLWLNEFIRDPLYPAGMLLFRLPSRIHPSPRKRPTILQKAGVKEVSVPSMHRYAIRSPFTISPAFFHMHRPCRSDIQNGWLSVAAMAVPVVKVPGWEGDDILGTIAARDEALGFETDNTPFMALHDGVALSEPSFLCQDIIPGSYLPDRFQPFGSENQRISVKARESACKDIDLPSPVPKIGRGNVRIALGVRKPIIQNPVAERINLAVESVLPSHSFGCQIRGTESAEKGSMY